MYFQVRGMIIMIKQSLDNLKSADIYSMILFALYKLIDIPEYSALSELAYVLDRKNLLNLCEYFGGITIRIPTVDELTELTDALLLYQYVKIDKRDYDEAVNETGYKSSSLRTLKKNYNKICDILDNYTFKSRDMV